MRRRTYPLLLALSMAFVGVILGAPKAAQPAAASPLPAPATVTITEHVTLTTTNQSMFGPGGASPLANMTASLFNLSWNPAPLSKKDEVGDSIDFCYPEDQIPGIPSCYTDVKFGGAVNAASTGTMAMSAKMTGGTGGSVGVTYPVTASFTLPQAGTFAAGDAVAIQTTAALDNARPASITSVFPTYQSLGLDGTFGFTASASGEICFVDCGSFDFFPPITIPTSTGNVFSIPTADFTQFPGLGLTGHCFNVADNVLLGLGSVGPSEANPACVSSASNGAFTSNGYFFQPSVKLTSTTQADGTLSATGCHTYLAVPISSVAWAKRIITAGSDVEFPTGFPNLGPFTFKGVSLGYKALDVAFTTTETSCQTVTFKPQIQITLQFPQSLTYQVKDANGGLVGAQQTGTSATLLAGNQVVITTPHEMTGSLSITPTISVASDRFSNRMIDTVAETAHLTIGVLNLSFPSNDLGLSGFNAGPIYDQTYPLTSTPRTLFDQSFTLGGFTTPSVSPLMLTPDPRPLPTPKTITPVEGAPFSGIVAQFADPDTTETAAGYRATIDWGDHTAVSTGAVAGTGGQFSVSGSHTYEEEGTYSVTVTLTDIDVPTNIAVATSTANVADAPLTASGTGQTAATGGRSVLLWPVSAANGIVATFTDADPHGVVADFSATIAWGDGQSTAGTVAAGPNGTFTVTGAHSYASMGFFSVTTQIRDEGGSTASATTTILAFTTPQSGNFVISAANARVGANVTFWGAQWRSKNASGAPAQFKGFVSTPSGPTSCAAPATFSAAPGNSVTPPTMVPTFMAVLVTNPAQVSNAGPAISGPVTGVVVVQTNPGYGPDPGAEGTGTVIATICGGGS